MGIAIHAGHAAHHWVTLTSALTDHQLGQSSPAFWRTYLRFYHWSMLVGVAVVVGLASGGVIILRSQVRASSVIRPRHTPWLGLGMIGLGLGGVAWSWLASASSLAGRGLITPAFWHAYLQFHQWALIASVAVLGSLLAVSVVLRRVVTIWPIAYTSLALVFGIAAWNTIYVARMMSVSSGVIGSAWFWHHYVRFHSWTSLSSFAVLVGLVGAGAALLYARSRQPNEERARLDDGPALIAVPARPLGVTVRGALHVIGGVLMIPSLLNEQTPQLVLTIPMRRPLWLSDVRRFRR